MVEPLSRRALVGTAAVLFGALAAPAAQACTVTASRRPIGFSDSACRRSLRQLVALINEAASLSDDALTERAEELGIEFAESVTDPLMNYPTHHPIEDRDLIRAWGTSDGQRDRTPIALHEVNLLKGRKGVALYQFTLRRDRFHREVTEEETAGDTCGPFAWPAGFAEEDSSYLGLFINNKLREVSAFDQWLLEL